MKKETIATDRAFKQNIDTAYWFDVNNFVIHDSEGLLYGSSQSR